MKKVVILFFLVVAIASQSWSFGNVGVDVFGFTHSYFPVVSTSIDFLIPRKSLPLSIGIYVGFGAFDLVEDSNNPPTVQNPNYSFNGLALPMAARVGWHFIVPDDDKKFDLYAMFSGGYFFTFSTGSPLLDPGRTTGNYDSYNMPEFPDGWPLLEAGVGVRFLLFRGFGFYAEAGFNPMTFIQEPRLSLMGIRADVGITFRTIFDGY